MTPNYWKMTPGQEAEFFGKMTIEESQAFLRQYLLERHARLDHLQSEFIGRGARESGKLDFSPESLIPLWGWASAKFKKREWTEAEKPKKDPPPQWAHWDFRPFAEHTLYLLNDIAYYFAEVFIRNHPGISWEVCRTGDPDFVDENQPVLSGFIVPMNPRPLLRVVGAKTFDQRVGELALFDLYKTWVKNLTLGKSRSSPGTPALG